MLQQFMQDDIIVVVRGNSDVFMIAALGWAYAARPGQAMIWIRAVAFVLVVQVTVVGFIPWLLASVSPHLEIGRWRYLALIPVGVGVMVLLWCNWMFVTRGRGTAAPYEPPRVLVAQGIYRHVRNPMYVAAVLIVLGAAVWTGAVILLGYALLLALGYGLFVRYYEEPRLMRSFGASYVAYCRAVPRWGFRWRRRRETPTREP